MRQWHVRGSVHPFIHLGVYCGIFTVIDNTTLTESPGVKFHPAVVKTDLLIVLESFDPFLRGIFHLLKLYMRRGADKSFFNGFIVVIRPQISIVHLNVRDDILIEIYSSRTNTQADRKKKR